MIAKAQIPLIASRRDTLSSPLVQEKVVRAVSRMLCSKRDTAVIRFINELISFVS